MIKKIIPIIFIILLSGCVKVNSTEQLRRDGSMNVLIVIQSPYFSLTDSINKSIAPNPNITYIIDFMNSSIIYYFPKANLSENDLFISKNESSDLKIEPSGFLAGDTFKYSQEFRFPYYYYIYSANFSNASFKGASNYNSTAIMEISQDYGIDYDIVYFGELSKTNGEELSGKKIRFNYEEGKEYYLTFKEFFLFNWIGRMIEQSSI
jgi:hypothetical protein